MSAEKNRNVLVQFTQSYRNYNAGETAGFHETRANDLVAAGVAVFHRKPRPQVKEKPEPEAVEAVADETNAGNEPSDSDDSADEEEEATDDAPEATDNAPEGKILIYDGDRHAEHRGGGRYYIYDGEEQLSGPYTKDEILAAGYE